MGNYTILRMMFRIAVNSNKEKNKCLFSDILWNKQVVSGGWRLKEYIEERAVEAARYIVECKATVRQTAKKMGISKSTVHKDVTERLLTINPSLAARARQVLDVNKSERHIRGGMATKEKYLHRQ